MKLKIEFEQIEDELNKAYEANDIERISELLADQWTILESTTGLTSKEHFINSLKNGKLVQTKMVKDIQHVQIVDNIAIVVSKGKNEGQYAGVSYNSEQWVTNIYKRENSRWFCMMTLEIPAKCDDQNV
ncbi:nuclear transport factor 2 family protein [Arundinibacter roseus]|uniref:Nuclear transport factor 2 family protein n=1 Tax=Arundinibacter roseus TaxID=2070510 RepID=A0A4R4K983_9BACT|nr:nuclear transport factor 2 family protein [Arundinibacter roseus]TDB62759.1 nuclear transport factor 2 family protein [Arundinibacter roseus]